MTIEESANEYGPKLWMAINKAAAELPDGCEIHIQIENGSAWVDGFDKTGGYVDFDQIHDLPEDIKSALKTIKEEHTP